MKCAIQGCTVEGPELCAWHADVWRASPEVLRWQRAKHDAAADAAFVDFVTRVSAEHLHTTTRHADEGER